VPARLLLLLPRRVPLRPSAGFRIPSRSIIGRPGQLEIHLPLEGVHLRYLHFNPIAQFEHASRASARKLAARGVELIEIVAQPRERHQPAHSQPRYINKEPKIPHIGDQRFISCRLRGLKLRVQEGKHLHIPAVALRIIGVSLRLGNMIRDLLE
jgi:hypothetical protein